MFDPGLPALVKRNPAIQKSSHFLLENKGCLTVILFEYQGRSPRANLALISSTTSGNCAIVSMM